jgi:hypothetical protein
VLAAFVASALEKAVFITALSAGRCKKGSYKKYLRVSLAASPPRVRSCIKPVVPFLETRLKPFSERTGPLKVVLPIVFLLSLGLVSYIMQLSEKKRGVLRPL